MASLDRRDFVDVAGDAAPEDAAELGAALAAQALTQGAARLLHEVLESGVIGELVTVEHRENVAYWHMAHSFVRGHWRNKGLSSPMILAECSHDLVVLVW